MVLKPIIRSIFFLILFPLSIYPLSLYGQNVAGFRASRLLDNYPNGQFPGINYWPAAGKFFAQKFSNTTPGGIWIVSLYQSGGTTELQFPSSDSYPNVTFSSADSSESYLAALDAIGAKIWLQVEPGAADVDTLIDLVLHRYGDHPCIAGFGVDVEWYKANTHPEGKQVTDAEALSWETRVKSHNPNYTLFLKHWLTGKMPPLYRGDILFVDDSQDFPSLAAMTSEFKDWSMAFPANNVAFQFGYPIDSVWWKQYADPMKKIGDTLLAVIPNCAGLFWVDFTVNKVYPIPQTYYVATTGNDTNPGTEAQPWKTIQHAANSATPGSTVLINAGVYNEKIIVNVSGNAAGGYITFQNFLNDSVVVDGTGKTGDQIILIENKSYIKIIGLELRNNLNQSFGTGIWVQGFGSHIELRDNRIHDMRAASGGGDAMAISVYGSHATIPLSNIIIDNNHIYDCEPGHSEALTLNGNVDMFQVTNNRVHDVDNIGIDMIGGEGTSPTPANDAVRNGLCAENIVYNARSNYGGGYAAGIYVDGGRNIVVERNIVYQCDVGMEIGCENNGFISSGITVRNNLIYNNDKAGLGFGGYNFPTTGKVTTSLFTNNTVFNNDVLATGTGELWIQYAQNCTVKNNIFYSTSQNRLMVTTIGNANGNVLDYNLWFAPGGDENVTVDWDGTVYNSYSGYRTGTGQDNHSMFADPKFISSTLPNPDIHLQSSSPAIDAGDPSFSPAEMEYDLDGHARVVGSAIDIGAVEQVINSPGPPSVPQLISAAPGDGQVILRWRRNVESDFGKYRVFGGISANPVTLVDSVNTITDTVQTVSGLPNNVQYFFRITAVDLDGNESDFSNELSATPLSGSAPSAPKLVSVTRQETLFTFLWRTPEDAVSYHFQCSSNQSFLLPVVDDSSLTDTTISFADLNDSVVYYWRVNAKNALGSGGWSEVWSFSTMPGNISTNVLNRWNLVSLSADVSDAKTSVVFPTATSQAFSYAGNYSTAETLTAGKAYWLKFAGSQPVLYTGTEHFSDTIDVAEGWNLIGSISVPVAGSSLTALGTTIASALFGYEGGYFMDDSIHPGKGYWLKVDQSGQIIISPGSATQSFGMNNIYMFDGMNTITISDAEGNIQTLYYGVTPDSSNDRLFELPPIPPSGIFDVRFATHTIAEHLREESEKEIPIILSSAHYPLTINSKMSQRMVASLLIDGNEFFLHDNHMLPILNSNTQIILRMRLSAPAETPKEFFLSQNYPNPFNPVTMLEFQLPVETHVTLVIYDVLGREVETLINRKIETVRQRISWNASNNPSGVYFYKLTTEKFSAVRKMVLMK